MTLTSRCAFGQLASRIVNLQRRILRLAVSVLVGVPILVAVPAAAGAADDAAGDADFFSIDRQVVEFATADTELPQGTAGSRTGASALLDFDNRPEMLIIDTNGADATFAVRSLNGGEWSEWVEVETPFDESPDGADGDEGAGSVSAIGPIWLGDNAENAEIQLVSGAASSVTIEALDSTDDRPAVALPDGSVPEGTAASTPVGRPAIQPRSAWATSGWRSDNNGCENGPSYADNIRTVVVHHTVTTNTYAASQVDDIMRGIYRSHTVVNGWCDIAYNFVVDRFGTIWEARSGGADRPVIGGHSKGFNTWTAGVALLGQHHSGASPAAGAPTAAAIASVNAVASWKLSLHGVDPLGTGWLQNRSTRAPLKFPSWAWVEMPAIVGHRDLGYTSCPGSLTVPTISGMRTAAGTAHNTPPPHVAAGRTPAGFGPAFVTLASEGGLRAGGAAANVASTRVESGLSAVAVAGIDGKGQILRSDGSLRAFGGATAISAKPAGSRPVVDIAVASGGAGWVLDTNGFIFRFGDAPERSASTKPSSGRAIAMALATDGRGYVVDSAGGLHAVGGAPSASIGSSVTAIDIALRTSSSGWVLDSSGRLHPFGGAPAWQPERSVGAARAVLTGGIYGGWVVDSEGRFVRFGDERRIQPISTTVGTPTAVDAAVIGWQLGTADADMKYAAALTSLFLGSSATARISDHVAFRAVELGPPKVVAELAQSPEWAGALLAKMYNDVLGRDPDAQGEAYWLDQLRRGLRTQDLGALFYASPEYVEQAGSTDAWLRQLYRALLHREPDAAGFDYWKSRLAGGMTPPAVTALFYQSPESRQDRVTALYQQILRRNPESAGLGFWANRLFTIDDIRLAVELAVSAEYYNLVTDP